MRVVLLTYSLTRCTRRVADELCRLLRLSGHSADVFDVVSFVRPNSNLSFDSSILRSADAVGLGSMTWAWKEPPLLSSWLSSALGDSLKGKPGFVFATAGQSFGACPRNLALSLRSAGCRVVDRLVVKAPDTFVWYGPFKSSKPFLWGSDALSHVAPFVYTLVPRLEGTEPPMPENEVLYVHPFGRFLSLLPYESPALMAGAPEAEKSCVSCGVCVRSCPLGAIEFETEEATKRRVPKVDSSKCLGCTRCVALCPVGAMQSTSSKGRHMYVYSGGASVAQDGSGNNWSWLGMQSTFAYTAVLRHPAAFSQSCLTFLRHLCWNAWKKDGKQATNKQK